MYKRRNKKMYILMGVVIFLTVVAVALLYVSGRGKVTEPAPVKYEVRLYKTGEADISFPESYLQSDSEDEAVLDVVPDTMVELIVSPKEGKELESVSVMDHQFNSINTQRSRTAAEDERVLFPMPEKDVLVSFRFRDLETEKAAETRTGQGPETQESETSESETQPQTEKQLPYGLRLHGLDADIITSYNGMFEEEKFLQQLGDALHMDSARSVYRSVTDVTFSTERYAGEADANKIFHYIYFNDDPEWKVLATYDVQQDAYSFTEEKPEAQITAGGSPQGTTQGTQAGGAASAPSSYLPSGGSSQPVQQVTISLDLLSVSTAFLDYVGGEEVFYQKAFDYVVQSGLTGAITGTMNDYEIDANAGKANIQITLSTGQNLNAIYNKQKNSFQFSGL